MGVDSVDSDNSVWGNSDSDSDAADAADTAEAFANAMAQDSAEDEITRQTEQLAQLSETATKCLDQQAPIPSAPFVELSKGRLLGSSAAVARVQDAVDYLECKAKAGLSFTAPEGNFMEELYESFSIGGKISGMPEAAALADHYVNGKGTALEIDSGVYETSAVVLDTTEAMQSHIQDLEANGLPFEQVSTSSPSFVDSPQIRTVMSVNGSRSAMTDGYVRSDGLVFAEQANHRLQKADNRFTIDASTTMTPDGTFETTYRVENRYDFEPYSVSDKYTEIPVTENVNLTVDDGLSEYMDSGADVADAFDYHAEWTVRWQ